MHCVSAIVKDLNSVQIQVIKMVANLFITYSNGTTNSSVFKQHDI